MNKKEIKAAIESGDLGFSDMQQLLKKLGMPANGNKTAVKERLLAYATDVPKEDKTPEPEKTKAPAPVKAAEPEPAKEPDPAPVTPKADDPEPAKEPEVTPSPLVSDPEPEEEAPASTFESKAKELDISKENQQWIRNCMAEGNMVLQLTSNRRVIYNAIRSVENPSVIDHVATRGQAILKARQVYGTEAMAFFWNDFV